MMIDADGLDKLSEFTSCKVEEVDGHHYFINTKGVQLISSPLQHSLKVFSLSQLVKMIMTDERGAAPNLRKVIVNVESPFAVSAFYEEIDASSMDRDRLVHSSFTGQLDQFDAETWMSQEEMTIALQSQFLSGPGDDLPELLKLISSARAVREGESKDDGVSQIVEARAGIHLNSEVKIKNPWTLRPFMTFPEIPVQPIIYILRSRQTNSGVQFSLWDCDGGKHKIAYVDAIRDFLNENLKDAPEVIIL